MELVVAFVACVVAALALVMLAGAHRRIRALEEHLMQRAAGSDPAGSSQAGSQSSVPRASWKSFRLRTLLIFVAVAGGLLAWFGNELRRAEKQRTAVRTLGSFGAKVTYDFHVPEDWLPKDRRPPLPDWVRQLVGDDFGSRVLAVEFGTPFSGFGGWSGSGDSRSYAVMDAELRCLQDLPHLTHLSLSFTDVTDEGLAHLADLKDLQHINLEYTKITGTGLKALVRLPRLTTLQLPGLSLGDEAMSTVSEFPQLTELIVSSYIADSDLEGLSNSSSIESLDLTGTQLTDDGLRHVSGMLQLTALRLNDTHISDDGLAYLKRLPNLRLLEVDETAVTDAGIQHLKDFPQLRFLSLRVETLTDVSLQSLAQLGNLQQLNLLDDTVPEPRREALKDSLPGTIIQYGEITNGGFGGGGMF